MIVFKKSHKPLTIKLMFKVMLYSAIMMITVPPVIEAAHFRIGIMSPIIIHYSSGVCLVLGVLGFIVGLMGMVLSVMEK